MDVRRRLLRCIGALALWLAVALAPARAEPALWVIEDGRSTIYLFGTVHLLPGDARWETPKIRKALAGSRELWLEITDNDPATVQPLIERLGFERSYPLSRKLPYADVTRLDTAARAAGIAGGERALDPMRPWMAAMALEVARLRSAGFDASNGVDATLRSRAVSAGMPVRAFETAEQQLRIFADLPRPVEVEMLESVLDDAAEGTPKLQEIVEAWSRGDVAALEQQVIAPIKDAFPGFYQALFVRRNDAWADRLVQRLQSGRGVGFVAVGAGHLLGPDSLQADLEKRGVKSRRF